MKRLALILCLLAAPLFAVEPDEVLDDPVLEERARVISADVRCVVCQNALWLGPFVILALGFLAVLMALRGKRGQRTAALTAEEQARLEALRKKDDM